MGELAELYTPEELAILGEEAPEIPNADQEKPPIEDDKPVDEGDKPEPDSKESKVDEPEQAEKAAAEEMGLRIEGGYIVDDDGTKIPAKRWKALYRDYKETEQRKANAETKLNLFKELGQDKYYELYPDEAPEGFTPAGKKTEPEAPVPFEMGNMVVQGGPHDGKTLNDVYLEDPAYATFLQNQFLDSERQKQTKEKQDAENMRLESEKEISEFTNSLISEFHPGKKASELTPQEEKKISEVIQATLDFMSKTRRGGGIIADAYFLMNKDKLLNEAKEKGGKSALESLTQKTVIRSIDGTGAATLTNDYEAMTADQLASKIDSMSEKEAVKFFKTASESLRQKYPSLPWT